MSLNKLVFFVSDLHYIPAKKFVDLLTNLGYFQIETVKQINTTVALITLGTVEAKEIFLYGSEYRLLV